MEKFIPLHSLVVLGGTPSTDRLAAFPHHEVVSPEAVLVDLVGPGDRPDLTAIVAAEVRRRVAIKLSLGERVVVPAVSMRRDERLMLARVAEHQGSSVLYLPGAETAEWEFLRGDGLYEVIPASDPFRVVPAPSDDLLAMTSGRFRGITVVADLHGERAALRRVTDWAKSRRHFLLFLGDVLDYGSEGLGVVEDIYKLVMCGEATLILGNHERKIARWLGAQGGDQVRLSEGNRVTTDALRAMTASEKARWVGKFRSLLGRSRLIGQCGGFTFAHAAVHPHYWGAARPDNRGIENFALYGESDSAALSDNYVRSYEWVDVVPQGKMVFVGHDIRSTVAPMMVNGSRGGTTVFLDTGCGKGGKLSSADLRFDAAGDLRIENFNIH